MLSKSLIQFSVNEWGCVPSLLFDLRPNYGGGNEDNGDLLQKVLCKHCHTHCPQPCSRPLSTHASTGDSLTVTGKSNSVSCGDTAPFSCLLVHTRFCLCPPRVCFPCIMEIMLSNSTGLQCQIPWGFSVPLPDIQVEKSVVDPRTFLTVKNFFGIIVLKFVGRLLSDSMLDNTA